MFSKIKRLIQKKNKEQNGSKEELNIYEEFKEHLKNLLDIFLSAYYVPQLKWYEFIAIVAIGVLAGIGLGIIAYTYFKYPQSVIIMFSNGTIVKVPIR